MNENPNFPKNRKRRIERRATMNGRKKTLLPKIKQAK